MFGPMSSSSSGYTARPQGVRQHPGFIAGTWTLGRETAESFVMLTYASRESEGMKQNIVRNSQNQQFVGIELVGVRVLEVSASATAS
jgi:hypothetical protein